MSKLLLISLLNKKACLVTGYIVVFVNKLFSAMRNKIRYLFQITFYLGQIRQHVLKEEKIKAKDKDTWIYQVAVLL